MTTPPSGNPMVPFGKYRLLRKLAKGGMAELFLAADPAGKPIVIKRVLPHFTSDAEFLQMFLDEARLAAQLNHPSIVRVEDLGQEREHLFLAMEYIDGIDLERLVKLTGGKLPAHIAARVGTHVCNALYYANNFTDLSGKPLNIIHRDVTPGNIMITRRGAVKLVDFGIAKVATLERTRPGIVKGKFRYMSPEQVRQKTIDGRSDLFSLGSVLYEMTTGQKPFDGAQVIDIVRALVSHEPPPPEQVVPGFPHALSQAIMRALEKDLSVRYPDGREMQRVLEEALAKLPPSGPREMAEFIAPFLKPSPFPADVPPANTAPPRRETRPPMPAAIAEPPTSPERAIPGRAPAAAIENEPTSPRMGSPAPRPRTPSGSVRRVTLPPRPAVAEPPTIDESAGDDDKTTVDLQRPSMAPTRPPPFVPNEPLPPTDVRRPPPAAAREARPSAAARVRPRSMEMMVIDEQVLEKAPPEMAREILAEDVQNEWTRTIDSESSSTMRENASLIRTYQRRRLVKGLVVVGFVILSGLAGAIGWMLYELQEAPAPAAEGQAAAVAAPAEGTLVLEGAAGTIVEVDGQPGCTVPCKLRLREGQHTCASVTGKSRFKTVVNVPAGGTVRLPIPR